MKEEIENNPRLIVTIVGMGILAIAVIAIFSLILIWGPKPKKDPNLNTDPINNNGIVGKYEYQTISQQKIVEKYAKNIILRLNSKNIELIKEIVSQEYMSYKGLNNETLLQTLEARGLLAPDIVFDTYSVITHHIYGKIYEIKISNMKKTFSENIYIVEKSPNDYKVSFEGFIAKDTTPKTFSIEGMQLEVLEITTLLNSVTIRVSIKNKTGNTIILNEQNSYENIYGKFANNVEYLTNTIWLAGAKKELTNDMQINLDLNFLVNTMKVGAPESIMIKDILDTFSKENKNIEFKLR